MPVASFGIFSAIIIPVNYFIVITAYPALLNIWARYLKHRSCLCCCRSRRQVNLTRVDNIQQDQSAMEEEENLSSTEAFFAYKWSAFVNKCRIPILCFFAAWLGFCVWQASMISPLSKTEIYLPDTVPIEQARRTVETTLFHNLGEDDKLIKMRLMWGLESISNHDESDWDSSKYGTLVWDEDFNLAPQLTSSASLTSAPPSGQMNFSWTMS